MTANVRKIEVDVETAELLEARAAAHGMSVSDLVARLAALEPGSSPRLTVWYNTRCPVCDAGIDRQRNKLLAAVQAGTIAFRDINLEPDALAAHGASLEDIRRRLHATDEAGHLLVGADVAFAVWRLTPGEHRLAGLFGNPVMRPLSRFVYDRFADLLYAWNRRKGHW